MTENSYRLVAGVDEVGRGPLAGDVVAAAVVLNPDRPIEGLADSKKLSESKRNVLAELIKRDALAWAVGRASVEEIDELNILHASLLAMRRAVEALAKRPDHCLVDGNRCPDWSFSSQAIVGGDAIVAEISAASIIAKVTRDAEMVALDSVYSGYGLARHKGYPTRQHMEALEKQGPSPIHRKSFAPVRRLLAQFDNNKNANS